MRNVNANKIISVLIAFCFPLVAQSASLLCDKMYATGNPEYPPYLWQDSDDPNKLVGANTIIFEEISERLGIPIEVKFTGPWSRAQQELRGGRVDLMAGAFYTKPRLEYMDYVYPAFLNTRSVVWKKRDAAVKYARREDLIPLQGVTVIHNSFGQEFDQFAQANLTISTVPSLKQAFSMLTLGRVNYLLYESNPALAYASQLKVDNKVEVVGPPISTEGLYLTISHKSTCNNGFLRGRLAQIVADLVADGTTQKALESGHKLWKQSTEK